MYRVCDMQNPDFGGNAWLTGWKIDKTAKFKSMQCDGRLMSIHEANYYAKNLADTFGRPFGIVNFRGMLMKVFSTKTNCWEKKKVGDEYDPR